MSISVVMPIEFRSSVTLVIEPSRPVTHNSIIEFNANGVSEFMPWTKSDYPISMKNLAPRIRGKAIEIANALLEDGMEEGQAIPIGTAKAKEWNENNPPKKRR